MKFISQCIHLPTSTSTNHHHQSPIYGVWTRDLLHRPTDYSRRGIAY